jgi:hypothetical protein
MVALFHNLAIFNHKDSDNPQEIYFVDLEGKVTNLPFVEIR